MTTRCNDSDRMGHVTNAAYYMPSETMQPTFYIEKDLLDMQLTSPYVVAEGSCRHIREAPYSDRLMVGIRVADLGRSALWMGTVLSRNDGDVAPVESHLI